MVKAGADRRFRLLMNYYHGFAPYGQFLAQKIEQVGIGLYLSFLPRAVRPNQGSLYKTNVTINTESGWRRESNMNGLPHALAILIVLTSAFQGCGLLATEHDTSKGKRLYEEHCIGCHGRGGKGDGYRLFSPPPADLTSLSTQKKLDADLLKTIHEGRPNTVMGAWKWVLSDEEAREVLAYVRSLSR